MAQGRDLVIVEGPSLQTQGGEAIEAARELPQLVGASVVVVFRYRPGLKSRQVLEAVRPFGQSLTGVLVNLVTRYRLREVRQGLLPEIEAEGVRVLGALPEERRLLSVTVGQIAEHLKGEWLLGREMADRLVEHLVIGGNILDWGVEYFGRRDNKAVVVRGDRPDIQMAALATPTSCLILTGGHRPIQYVEQEALRQGVPLILVEGDTLATAGALEGVAGCATVHHPGKVESFLELLRRNADLEALCAPGGDV
jgi:hypothetical protein